MTVRANVRARPLAGRRILITRAREQAGQFRRLLEEAGGEVLEVPTIRIEPPESWGPLDRAISRLDEFQWLIFTSVNGVENFRQRLATSGKDLDAPGRRVAAIGPATAEALNGLGVSPQVVPDEYRAEGLLEHLRTHIRPGDRVLLPRAAETRDLLVKELGRLGADVVEVAAYRTVAVNEGAPLLRRALEGGTVDVVTYTSSSTVRHFVAMFAPGEAVTLLRNVTVACIGPITAQTAVELGLHPDIMPAEYTIPALARAIIGYYSKKHEKE
ncbi:MAG: uroporphyrinogen-III synthase [Candidatus Rokubacteria bacterium]|nr:uroporphyrinogen-III synthase [Candidatus Rokubacteria bacterium]